MKEIIRLIFVLTLICVISSLLLAVVNIVTENPIAEAKRQEQLVAIEEVLPAYDNQPDRQIYVVSNETSSTTFYIGTAENKYIGSALQVSSTDGYGGTIKIMVGIDADGSVYGIKVLEQTETPGLGAKITETEFSSQYKGGSTADTAWCAVEKDNGKIQAITGATISSRAVSRAVKAGLELYNANADKIMSSAK